MGRDSWTKITACVFVHSATTDMALTKFVAMVWCRRVATGILFFCLGAYLYKATGNEGLTGSVISYIPQNPFKNSRSMVSYLPRANDTQRNLPTDWISEYK